MVPNPNFEAFIVMVKVCLGMVSFVKGRFACLVLLLPVCLYHFFFLFGLISYDLNLINEKRCSYVC